MINLLNYNKFLKFNINNRSFLQCTTLLVIVCLFGCAKYVYNVSLSSGTDIWYKGKKVAGGKFKTHTHEISYLKLNERNEYVFRVKFLNHSGKPATIGPEKFKLAVLSYSESKKGFQVLRTLNAVDPEIKIEQLINGIREENEDYSSDQPGFFSAVFDVMSELTVKTKKQKKELKKQRRMQHEQIAERKQDHHLVISKYKSALEDYSNHGLRKTTVKKSNKTEGHVYFPFLSEAKNLEIQIEFDGIIYAYLFKQSKHLK